MKANEQYKITYDPKAWTLTIEGGRLTQKVVRKIKAGKYYFVTYNDYSANEIEITFE